MPWRIHEIDFQSTYRLSGQLTALRSFLMTYLDFVRQGASDIGSSRSLQKLLKRRVHRSTAQRSSYDKGYHGLQYHFALMFKETVELFFIGITAVVRRAEWLVPNPTSIASHASPIRKSMRKMFGI